MRKAFEQARAKYMSSTRPKRGYSSGPNEPDEVIDKETDDWKLVRTGNFSSKLVWKDDGVFGNVEDKALSFRINEESKKKFQCPRGHTFTTSSPIIVAVDDEPEVNSGPICSYCYVNWFRANLNATEVTDDT